MDEVCCLSLLGPDAEAGLRLGAAPAFAEATLELPVTQATIEDERLQRITLLGTARLALGRNDLEQCQATQDVISVP